MDEYGYPTKKELKIIETWDIVEKPVPDLLEHIRSCWNWADTRFVLNGKRVLKLYLSTGGWSGNENIINALQENKLFWMMFWEKSQRGGHF